MPELRLMEDADADGAVAAAAAAAADGSINAKFELINFCSLSGL
jgi:hypothetical protein